MSKQKPNKQKEHYKNYKIVLNLKITLPIKMIRNIMKTKKDIVK